MDYDALERLVGLRNSGALTDEEFEQQKQMLLNSAGNVLSDPMDGETRTKGHFFVTRWRSLGWPRAALIFAIVVVVLAGSVFTYVKVSEWRAAEAAHQAAIAATKKAFAEQTAGATDILKSEYEDSGTTYAQLFDKVDDRVKKIEDASVSAQSSDIDPVQKEALANYADALANTLRSMALKDRKSLSVSTNIDLAKSAKDDYYSTPYNEYSDAWERRRMAKALEDAKESLAELKSAATDFGDSLATLKAVIEKNKAKLEGYSLVKIDVIDKAIKKNSTT